MKKAGASEDLRFDPSELSGNGVVAHLDTRIHDVLREIEAGELALTADLEVDSVRGDGGRFMCACARH